MEYQYHKNKHAILDIYSTIINMNRQVNNINRKIEKQKYRFIIGIFRH